MKPLVGGIIGAVITGVAVTGWQSRTPSQESFESAAPGDVRLVSSSAPAPAFDPAAAAPLSVRCEPGQRAVLRQASAFAGTTTEAACVSDPAYAEPSTFGPGVVSMQPRVIPASYSAPERVAPVRVVEREAPRRVEQKRSWKKTALVIGGSAGAGAGVGALAGGKKGALIGAAIGGGAATLYEAIKR